MYIEKKGIINMINVRNGIFETNSSSTHAMVVAAAPARVVPTEVYFGICEFGWEWDMLYTISEKAAYLYTSALCIYGKSNEQAIKNKLTAALAIFCINCFFEQHEWYKDTDWLDNGNIDHCGEDQHKEWVDLMLNNPDDLVRFLFNSDSYIVTGNDNCDEFEAEEFNQKMHPNYAATVYYKGN